MTIIWETAENNLYIVINTHANLIVCVEIQERKVRGKEFRTFRN